MKTYLTYIITLILAFSTQAQDFENAKKRTQKLLKKELRKKDVHNAFLAVYSPSKNINWVFADGEFQNGEKVTKNTPFHTASIGKTFTATAIAMLSEQDKLDFSDKITEHIPDSIVNGLHVYEGKDYSQEITIAQLLQHTSGLPDYYEGETVDGTPNAMSLMFADTGKFWSPIEMINLAKRKMKPNFAPGTGYQYSDTEYILLGLIIEKVSGVELHDFLKESFFSPLEMNQTSMHLRSESISETTEMAELYAEDFEIGSFTSLSLDWAGGGLTTTPSDLNKFQEALHTHKILKNETLKQMKQWVPESKGMYYGFGLRKVDFKKLFPTLPDLHIVGHTGSTSSFMFYCPELDVYLSGTLNQLTQGRKSIVIPVKVLAYIKKATSI